MGLIVGRLIWGGVSGSCDSKRYESDEKARYQRDNGWDVNDVGACEHMHGYCVS